MTTLLRKIFIRDYQNVNNQKVREKHGKLAGLVGIVSNLCLFGIKLFAGILSGSISVIADSINNLSDMGSSIITLVGFKLSGKPADDEHPFGHERIEYIAGLIISIIIMSVGGQLLYQSILKIISKEPTAISYLTIIILSISVVIKIWQTLFNKRIGKIINSVTLQATAIDSRNDVIATTVILIGAAITLAFEINLDAYFGVLVSIFIIVSAIKLIKETTNPLIGMSPEHEYIKSIVHDIKNYDKNVLGIHDVVCHMYGPTRCFMSVHVEVPAEGNFMNLHDMVDNIEHEMRQKYRVELVIHMDPVDTECELTNHLKHLLINKLKEISSDLSLHDFRVVLGPTHTNIIFDVVVPFKFKMSHDTIKLGLYEALIDEEGKYNLVINYDNSCVNEEGNDE